MPHGDNPSHWKDYEINAIACSSIPPVSQCIAHTQRSSWGPFYKEHLVPSPLIHRFPSPLCAFIHRCPDLVFLHSHLILQPWCFACFARYNLVSSRHWPWEATTPAASPSLAGLPLGPVPWVMHRPDCPPPYPQPTWQEAAQLLADGREHHLLRPLTTCQYNGFALLEQVSRPKFGSETHHASYWNHPLVWCTHS